MAYTNYRDPFENIRGAQLKSADSLRKSEREIQERKKKAAETAAQLRANLQEQLADINEQIRQNDADLLSARGGTSPDLVECARLLQEGQDLATKKKSVEQMAARILTDSERKPSITTEEAAVLMKQLKAQYDALRAECYREMKPLLAQAASLAKTYKEGLTAYKRARFELLGLVFPGKVTEFDRRQAAAKIGLRTGPEDAMIDTRPVDIAMKYLGDDKYQRNIWQMYFEDGPDLKKS